MSKRTLQHGGMPRSRRQKVAVDIDWEEFSSDDDDDVGGEKGMMVGRDKGAVQGGEAEAAAAALPKESAQEKRVRMAQEYLKMVEETEHSNDGARGREGRYDVSNGHEDDVDDDDIGSETDDEERRGITGRRDLVNARVKNDMLKDKGRLRQIAAPSLREACASYDFATHQTSFKGHALPITCLALSEDEGTLFSASKDKRIIRWDVETGKK